MAWQLYKVILILAKFFLKYEEGGGEGEGGGERGGGSNWPLPLQKKLPSKSPALLGLRHLSKFKSNKMFHNKSQETRNNFVNQSIKNQVSVLLVLIVSNVNIKRRYVKQSIFMSIYLATQSYIFVLLCFIIEND